jgi:hypothetical protein
MAHWKINIIAVSNSSANHLFNKGGGGGGGGGAGAAGPGQKK